jgi:hypothetical protein
MLYRLLLIGLFLELILGSPKAYAKEVKDVNTRDASQSEELLTRIDFGNSYVTGQSLKSGAIYLLQRKKNQVKSMLTYREEYRKEILESHDVRKIEEPSKDDVKKDVK